MGQPQSDPCDNYRSLASRTSIPGDARTGQDPQCHFSTDPRQSSLSSDSLLRLRQMKAVACFSEVSRRRLSTCGLHRRKVFTQRPGLTNLSRTELSCHDGHTAEGCLPRAIPLCFGRIFGPDESSMKVRTQVPFVLSCYRTPG